MIGLLTQEERKVKVQRYLRKKINRKGPNDVRYQCRKSLAHKRFRFQGRFIKSEDLHKFEKDFIIDFHSRKLIKPVFYIQRIKKRDVKFN